ncbi:MAG: hypothetical protein KDD58_06355 [Bdellovibrionales bacterium]|nr:hypothetical protein [Bdellovibrionales bacterium]
MKKLTKIGLIAAMFASIAMFTACSSKDKAQEESAESALVEQTQDLMSDESLQETPDIEQAGDIADSESAEIADSTDSSNLDNDPYADTTPPLADESDLGATSSGLGH